MKVLQIHNTYKQPGGEDVVARAESRILRSKGVDVLEVRAANDSMFGGGLTQLATQAASLVYSRQSYELIRAHCEQFRPDVAHVHNFWMKFSPSIHSGCHDAGVPTVQTLHNFRLLCSNGLLLRDGQVCEDCVGHMPWRGVVRRCYHNSYVASAAVAGMIAYNRRRSTWQRDVDLFVALSGFSRSKFIEGGLPAEKIAVKPNFVEDRGSSGTKPSDSESVVFVGRLAPEKGVSTLLQAWADGNAGWLGRLLIVGDGPERPKLEKLAAKLGLLSSRLAFLGNKTHDEVLRLISESRAVVIPSLWYENFPMIVVESLMCGRPILASDIGALKEIVPNREVGLRFMPGEPTSLAASLRTILTEGDLADQLGHNARSAYLQKYTPERNYQQLMKLYDRAIETRGIPARLAVSR